MKNLKDTVELMFSEDYRERFYAEYWQTKIRYEKLKRLLNQIEVAQNYPGVDMPKHDCPFYLLRDQQSAMGNYLHQLELRAVVENIDLDMEM